VYSAEGSRVVERSLDLTKVRELAIPGMERVRALALSPDGATLAVGGGVAARAGFVALVDPKELKVLTLPKDPAFKDTVETVAFDERGATLAAGSADKTAAAFDVKTLTQVASFLGHTGAVLAAAVRGGRLVTGSADRTLRVWNLATGELERTLTQHSGPVECVAFEHAGARVVSASSDRTVRLWDPATGRLVRIVKGFEGPVLALCASEKGLFAAGADGRVRHVALDDGTLTPVGEPRPGWTYALALQGGALFAGSDAGVRRLELR
jgi:WD40 repeat protein